MKTYKLKIPIGELFKFLNIDNKLYDTIQPVNDRLVKIKTKSGNYSNINAFIKKQGYIKKYKYDGGYIECDEKHKIKQHDGSFSFINDTNHVMVNSKIKNIKSISNRYFGDVYDIAIDYPHEYVTSSGVESHNTTLAKILSNSIECDHLYINASDENSVDSVRNKIKNFTSTIGFKDLKVVVLDEADFISPQGQAALRNLMETFSKHSRFILTCNYVERIIDPIQSRCQTFQVVPPSKKEIAIHIKNILDNENIEYNVEDIVLNVNSGYPDIRRIINSVQQQSINGKLTIDKRSMVENDYKLKLLEILKTQDKKNAFKNIRQLLADSQVTEFADMYRLLFDEIDSWASGHIAECILELAEGQFKEKNVVDREINFMATIINLLNIIK